jgi:hypothetical protein
MDLDLLNMHFVTAGRPFFGVDRTRDTDAALLREVTHDLECRLFDITLGNNTLHDATAVPNKDKRHFSAAATVVDPTLDGLDLPDVVCCLVDVHDYFSSSDF